MRKAARESTRFFQVFLNLLQIGMTLNGIIHEQLERGASASRAAFSDAHLFSWSNISSATRFQSFWTLDETLAGYAVPLLEALAASEVSVNNPTPKVMKLSHLFFPAMHGQFLRPASALKVDGDLRAPFVLTAALRPSIPGGNRRSRHQWRPEDAVHLGALMSAVCLIVGARPAQAQTTGGVHYVEPAKPYGASPFLKTTRKGAVSAQGTLQIPLITWAADGVTVSANGGLEPNPNSPLARALGRPVKLEVIDDFDQQVQNYVSGKSPFLRGTADMIALVVASVEKR